MYDKHWSWMKIWFNIAFKSQNIMCQPYGTMIGLVVCDKLCKSLMYKDYTKCIYYFYVQIMTTIGAISYVINMTIICNKNYLIFYVIVG